MTKSTIEAGSEFPHLAVPKVGGGEIRLGGPGGWRMLVVYRGKHCPLCKTYLKNLGGLLDGYGEAGVEIVVASGDPKEKAETEAAEEGWTFPVGYGLSVDQMRALGLYISNPRSPQETDRPFPEPGVFVINPEGRVQVVDISNAPFARPDLANLLNGIRFVQKNNYPVRGTAA
jgi:peroxiredoxin